MVLMNHNKYYPQMVMAAETFCGYYQNYLCVIPVACYNPFPACVAQHNLNTRESVKFSQLLSAFQIVLRNQPQSL